MFSSIARPDHSNRVLATPPSYCISLNDARTLRALLLKRLPIGSTVDLAGLATTAGGSYPEAWLQANVSDHDRPIVIELTINCNIGQKESHAYQTTAAILASIYMASPRRAFESIYDGCGATQQEIEAYHLRAEAVDQAIEGLYK